MAYKPREESKDDRLKLRKKASGLDPKKTGNPDPKDEEVVLDPQVQEVVVEEEKQKVVPVGKPKVESEFVEKVIAINRITKVTKGGKKLSFSALVVVGDTRGKVGYNLSKASEVSIAIRKAMAKAKGNMIRIPMKGTTITHEVIGECGASRVLLKPASDGTGVIASGPVRAICDGAGIRNILTKCHRSNNPVNVVKATIEGLMRLKAAH